MLCVPAANEAASAPSPESCSAHYQVVMAYDARLGVKFLAEEETALADTLVPKELLPEWRTSYMVQPLQFRDQALGYALLELNGKELTAIRAVAELLSSAVKASELAQSAVRAATQRRDARPRGRREAGAGVIREQFERVTKRHSIPGFDLCVRVSPNTRGEEGGYFDLVPCEGGCWLSLGDSSGGDPGREGTNLVLQGIVAALVHAQPDNSPEQSLRALERALTPELRQRLGCEDTAPVALLRYRESGEVLFAGSHPGLLVYRKQGGRCEALVPPDSPAQPCLSSPPLAGALTLEPGDFLLLCSDRLCETPGAGDEPGFGERLGPALETSTPRSASQLAEGILEALRSGRDAVSEALTLVVLGRLKEIEPVREGSPSPPEE